MLGIAQKLSWQLKGDFFVMPTTTEGLHVPVSLIYAYMDISKCFIILQINMFKFFFY